MFWKLSLSSPAWWERPDVLRMHHVAQRSCPKERLPCWACHKPVLWQELEARLPLSQTWARLLPTLYPGFPISTPEARLPPGQLHPRIPGRALAGASVWGQLGVGPFSPAAHEEEVGDLLTQGRA